MAVRHSLIIALRRKLQAIDDHNMLKITNFRIDPVETPGLVHVDNLTKESARETTILLEENNQRYHIFTTTEDDKGVSSDNSI